ncbi:MAG: NAD-dependent succinate-semialdehyde dehydrogenase [Trueperaceae bacterium]|nr:NAD-dependent succinate-semialdehyde dehydrogenase [Trueperaceae bacterium]
MTTTQQRFDGRYLTDDWHDTQTRYTLNNPATGEAIAEVADCGAAEAEQAAEISARVFESFKQTTAFERAGWLEHWHDLIMANQETLARTMTEEMGKPIKESRGEIAYAAGFVKWYAEEAKRVYGDTFPSQSGHKRLFALKQPVGPSFAITPWNFPAGMVTRKAAPALAAGCTFILKPAEQTPLTALYLAALWQETGAPAGSLQVLTALDPVPVSDVLIADARIRKITFTGSTEVGRLLYRKAADTVKRISLELGGHAPFLIFEDADIDQAVAEAIACKFRNAGQTCVCTNRIYVQRPILDEFTARYVEATRALSVGDPLQDDTDIGPLVDRQGLDKVKAHVADALTKGAKVALGGNALDGLYFEPTVLTNISSDMQLMHEETFGPVAPIIGFDHDDEALRLANDTPYGLAAYLYTHDLSRAFRVAEGLDYGIVGLNDGVPSTPHAPFGGYKQSGIGREGGKWGIEEYLETKYLSMALRRS